MSDTSTNRTGVMKLWLLNFLANAAVLLVWYFWLLIPDAHVWQVAASALIAVAVVVSVLWLRAGTLAWFRMQTYRHQAQIGPAYRHSLRYIPALAFWVLVFLLVAWGLWSLHPYLPQSAVWVRQKLNGGPPPRNIMNDLNWLLLVVIFYIMPALWLPIATTVAASGVHPTHIARSRRVWKRPLYWFWLAILLLVGIWVPYKLVWWIPSLQTLRQQTWSVGGRFGLAYFVAISAFIVVVWVTGIYTEREDPIVG
jgi:hypothetical protein